ncbi:adenosine deaminase [Amaricoccus sp.]|uniref:adenosine deaminase n=1 Tax=Amaricoccus sp. TaxID=1872485 RepID=UPI001B575556|nr:adenosine deaminase [Amaricoccus sp.]MBP7000851.1 adenosine deaminase [Amaricoccus sp.]
MTAPGDWTALPKVELHLHLEGAAPPAFIRTLAAEKHIDLSRLFTPDGAYRWSDFAGFLRTYEAACSVLATPDDFRRLVAAVLQTSAAQGVIYAELFLAPDLCAAGDPAAWPDFLAAMGQGADAVPAVEARFIPVAIRHLGRDRAERAARTVAATPHPRVTGFGLAGEERVGHPSDYARAFAAAAEAGLGLTAHAGEVAGPESVAAVLDCLPVTRIGHGVRAIEDPALVRRLAAEEILLEVCPGSNLALGLYPDWPSHPVARLRAAGVRVSLSTDDPPYFHTTLSAEYAALAQAFGWTPADLAALNRDALAGAFCDDATRARLLARLERE